MRYLLGQMPYIRAAVLAASLAATAAMAPAQAVDTVDISVNAQIVGVCKFFGSGYTMTIANSGTNIDPSAAGPATGSVEVEYRCSNGTTPSFTVPGTLDLTGLGTMQATFDSTDEGQGTGMGSGQTKKLTVNGSIAQAQFEDAPVGSYSGNLTIQINW